MTNAYHAVVWIDHHEARILRIGRDHAAPVRVHASDHAGHLHHKAGSAGSGHAAVDRAFLAKVAQDLADTQRVLIVGPGTARTELANYIRDHVPALAPHIAGVEPMDRRTDGEIADHARRYFQRDDRFTGLN